MYYIFVWLNVPSTVQSSSLPIHMLHSSILPSIQIRLRPSVCPSVRLFVQTTTCQFVRTSVCPSVNQSILNFHRAPAAIGLLSPPVGDIIVYMVDGRRNPINVARSVVAAATAAAATVGALRNTRRCAILAAAQYSPLRSGPQSQRERLRHVAVERVRMRTRTRTPREPLQFVYSRRINKPQTLCINGPKTVADPAGCGEDDRSLPSI